MPFFYALLIYLLLINGIAYASMYSDKSRAKAKRRRIPEKRLFTLALLGGSAGILLGMRRFRHKTLHTSFRLGIPALLILNAAVCYGVLRLMLQ